MRVRHYTWLTTTPKGKKESRFETLLSQDSHLTELPELIGYDHVYEYLYELGFASGGAMSIQPLTFTEIKSWSDLMKTPLSIFEAESIHYLSKVYVSQRHEAEDPLCPTPFAPEVWMNDEKRSNVTNFFKTLASKKKARKR